MIKYRNALAMGFYAARKWKVAKRLFTISDINADDSRSRICVLAYIQCVYRVSGKQAFLSELDVYKEKLGILSDFEQSYLEAHYLYATGDWEMAQNQAIIAKRLRNHVQNSEVLIIPDYTREIERRNAYAKELRSN